MENYLVGRKFALSLVCFLLVTGLFLPGCGQDASDLVDVPAVIGLTQAEATATLTNVGLVVGNIAEHTSTSISSGVVISQDPISGNTADESSSVSLVVSLGPPLFEVPDLTGLTPEQAEAALLSAGLSTGGLTTVSSSLVAAGQVISQTPSAGAQVIENTQVAWVLSAGPSATDADGDGIADELDLCPDTVTELIVDATECAIAGSGIALAEVYDESSGKRLEQVEVILRGNGEEAALTIDGQMSQSLETGDYEFEFKKAGYSTVYRSLTIVANEASAVFDVRLTPLAAPVSLTAAIASEIVVDEAAAIRVSYSAESVAVSGEVTVTRLTGQGLPAPLPGGWSPELVLKIESDISGLGAPALYPGSALPDSTIAAVYETAESQWRRVPVEIQGLQFQLQDAVTGTVVLIVPDTVPVAPPAVEVGEVIAGIAISPIDVTAQLTILPSPEIVFISSEARSSVSAEANGLYSSGSTFELEISEVYELKDGSRSLPPGSVQDFVLYQHGDSSGSNLVVSPTADVDAFNLDNGTIYLSAYSEKSGGATLVDGSYPQSLINENITLSLPAGSSETPFSASVNRLQAAQFFSAGSGVEFVQGIEINLSDVQLPTSAQLSVQIGELNSEEHRYVFVRPVSLAGGDYYEYIGRGVVEDGSISLDLTNMPSGGGINNSGRVVLLRFDTSLAYVSGSATAAQVTDAEIIVGTDQSRVVSLVNDAGDYELAIPVAENRLFAIELTVGHEDSATVNSDQPGEMLNQDFNLIESPPSIVQIQPADLSENVNLLQPITILFSQVMDPSTVSEQTLVVSTNGESVPGTVSLSTDQRTLVFNRNIPWDGETEYTLVFNNTITNPFGVAPVSGEQWAFTTATSDDAPPLTQDGISSEYVAVDQLQIAGGVGTLVPGSLVTATVNGATTTVVAGNNGSFTMVVTAKPTDDVQLEVPSLNGGDAQQLNLELPLAVTGITLDQAALVLANIGAVSQLVYEVEFSRVPKEGESTVASVDFTVTDGASVVTDSDGTVTAIAEGESVLIVAASDGVYRRETAINVTVLAAGELIGTPTITVEEGLYFESESGFILDIPEGAVDENVEISIRKIDPTDLNLSEFNTAQVMAIYELKPDISFNEPIDVWFPIETQVDQASEVTVYRGVRPDFRDLIYDTVSHVHGVDFTFSNDVEVADQDHQHLSHLQVRGRNSISVTTDHFSFRVLIQEGRNDTGNSTWVLGSTIPEVDSVNAPFTPDIQVYRPPGDEPSQLLYTKPDGNIALTTVDNRSGMEYFTHHAVHPSVAMMVEIELPRSVLDENGKLDRELSLRVCGNNMYHTNISSHKKATTFLKVGKTKYPPIKKIKKGRKSPIKEKIYTRSATEIILALYASPTMSHQSANSRFVPHNGSDAVCVGIAGQNAEQTQIIALRKESTEQEIFSLRVRLEELFSVFPDIVSYFPDRPDFGQSSVFVNKSFSDNQWEYMRRSIDKATTTQYHITQGGVIGQGHRDTREVWHANSNNARSLGVELVHTGNRYDFFTGEQIDSLISLTDHAVEKYYTNSVSNNSTRIGLRDRFHVNNGLTRGDNPNRFLISFDESRDALNHPVYGKDREIVSSASNGRLRNEKLFIRHSESMRDETGARKRGRDAGSKWRRADPISGTTYNIRAIESALYQDFPGIVNTSGGDIKQILGECVNESDCRGSSGGRVEISYGEIWSESELRKFSNTSNFVGSFGTKLNRSLKNVEIAKGQTKTCEEIKNEIDDKNDDGDPVLANLIVDGVLDISSTGVCVLYVNGTTFLSPTGVVNGRGVLNSPSGADLNLYSRGPIILHGLVDLRGFSLNESGISNGGGNLTVRSSAKSPLQVPTIITRGGDLGYFENGDIDNYSPTVGEGGEGGNVYITGYARSSIVFSGYKYRPPEGHKYSCDYDNQLIGSSENPFGDSRLDSVFGAFPHVNRIPSETGVLLFDSNLRDDLDAVEECGVPDYYPNETGGLNSTYGRGIVTSGGIGASIRTQNASSEFLQGEDRDFGGNGGGGGNISIRFSDGGLEGEGILRFRDVTFITGGGAGLLSTELSVALEFLGNFSAYDSILADLIVDSGVRQLRYLVPTGSSGGRGMKVIGGKVLESPHGGSGGRGGAAGSIIISPLASVPDITSEVCIGNIVGHDASASIFDNDLNPALPKDLPIQVIGKSFKFTNDCAVSDSPGLTLYLDTSPSVAYTGNDVFGLKQELAADCMQDDFCLLGGSGGVPGGSSRAGYLPFGTAQEFNVTGTSGKFGGVGTTGRLEVPEAMRELIKSNSRNL